MGQTFGTVGVKIVQGRTHCRYGDTKLHCSADYLTPGCLVYNHCFRKIFIQKQLGIDKTQFLATIIGWVKGKFIIITYPESSGFKLKAETNNPLIASTIYKGEKILFKTTLIKDFPGKFHFVFIRYPEIINEVALRKHKRVSTFIPCELEKGRHHESSGEFVKEDRMDSTVVDLSKLGAQVSITDASVRLVKGDIVSLNFLLPNGIKVEGLLGEIMGIKLQGGTRRVGVKFLENQRVQLIRISSFFARMQIE